jgi:sugar phosphate isomerase/epimerase
MKTSSPSSRRDFLKLAGLAATAAALPHPAVAAGGSTQTAPSSATPALRFGVASYSFRKLSVDAVIESMHALRTPWLNLKSFHLPYELTSEALAAARQRYEAAGLQIVGGGTITLQKDTDEDMRPYFVYAKAAGMPLIVAAPSPATLPRVERFAREFDLKIAIHNHGPEDKFFQSAVDVLKHIDGMDPRMGLCLDIGHATRAGADIVAEAKAAGARLFDVHMKDLKVPTDKDSQCIVGEGVLPIGPFLRQLQLMHYPGCVNLEYEIDEANPLPGMLRSIAYLRGIAAGFAAS